MSNVEEDGDMPEEIDFSQSAPNPYVGRIRKCEVAGDIPPLERPEHSTGNTMGALSRESC